MQVPYKMKWPRDGLFVNVFAHRILNYRYNWHESDYEINIILNGKAEFSRDGENCILEKDDVLIIDPGIGHASFPLEADTISLVLHLSAKAFKPFLASGKGFSFRECVSDVNTKHQYKYKQIRRYVAQLMLALNESSAYSNLTAKASVEMILSTLCCHCEPKLISASPDPDDISQETLRRITTFLDEHYSEKLTLEDLSNFTQYNRTYISTFFKAKTGINFHKYLTRVRLQHAAYEIVSTSKTLTEIAVDNGFSELKLFNNSFRTAFNKSPTEYRYSMKGKHISSSVKEKVYLEADHYLIKDRILEYAQIPKKTKYKDISS